MLIISILVCGNNVLPCSNETEINESFSVIIKGEILKNTIVQNSARGIRIGDTITSELKEDVLTYYEYMQFKRARFNCDTSKIEYRTQTGRIKCMTFDFTGEIN